MSKPTVVLFDKQGNVVPNYYQQIKYPVRDENYELISPMRRSIEMLQKNNVNLTEAEAMSIALSLAEVLVQGESNGV